MDLLLETITPADPSEIAALLQRALFDWYESRLGQGHRFGTNPARFRIFPEIYAKLDPGATITARDTATGALLGVCFTHPRETHHGIGIVATAPDAAGHGVARTMMAEAINRAKNDGDKPLRLVSSLWNLDSFSLYTRLGFVPANIYQDIVFNVPAAGLQAPPPADAGRVRPATHADLDAIDTFERTVLGVTRRHDYAFFLNDTPENWAVRVCETNDGTLNGVLAACLHPDAAMTGPGAATDSTAAIALLWHTLHEFAGRGCLILAPAADPSLVATLYRWGGRNVEIHAAQHYGAQPHAAGGLAFPSFLPESG